MTQQENPDSNDDKTLPVVDSARVPSRGDVRDTLLVLVFGLPVVLYFLVPQIQAWREMRSDRLEREAAQVAVVEQRTGADDAARHVREPG